MPTRKTVKPPRPPKPTRIHATGYGFPESTKGLLPWSWAEQRLKKSHNYWFTTVKPTTVKPTTVKPTTVKPTTVTPRTPPKPHTMVVWALWQDGRILFSTGSTSRKARNLAENANCVVCTEHAQEAIIVEGIAEIADKAARRKFLPAYEKKYKFDMGKMKDDILSMKEPVFAVRPQLVFALWEKYFQSKSTRWKF